MSFQIRSVLGDSLYRLFSRNGLILVGAVFLMNVLLQIGLSSLFIGMWEEFWDEFVETYPEFADVFDDTDDLFPLAVDVPDSVALAIVVIGVLLSLILLAVALRVFYSTEEHSIKTELVFDNIAWVTVNLFVGLIIFFILWSIGLALLIIPGIFVFVSFIYFIAAVSVEDRSFVDGFSRSWSLARGNRFKIFLLFFAVFVITIVAAITFALFTAFIHFLSPLAGTIVDQLWNALITLYFAAVVAISFRSLVEPDAPEEDVEETPTEDTFEEFTPADQDAHW